MSETARALLGYRDSRSEPDPCFFAHIHGRNLLPVMRDVASMVSSGKTSARWIARMRTAAGEWMWMRLTARRLTSEAANGIVVWLERLDTG